MTATEAFHCPTCGAPLSYAGGTSPTIQCPYCRSSVVVPESLRPRGLAQGIKEDNAPIIVTLPQANPRFTPYDPQELARIASEMAGLVQAGNKIAAIKLFREKFPVGLKEAKDVADQIGDGRLADANQVMMAENEKLRQQGQPMNMEGLAGISNELSRLLREGKKIEAIKRYRETFDVGLKEAKDAVERLEAGEGIAMASVTVTTGGNVQPVQVTTHLGPVTTIPGRQVARAAAGTAGAAGCFAISLVAAILLITAIPLLFAFIQPGGPLAGAWAKVNPLGYGRVTLAFGEEGTGQGMFQDPRSIGVDADGNIYIGEYEGGRVQVFDASGKFRSLWLGEKKRILEALAVDRKGVVYLAYGGEIHRADAASGTDLGLVEKQEDWYFDDVAVAPDGGLVTLVRGETIVRFDASGKATLVIPDAVSTVSGDSELDGRVAVDGLGNIYVLATFNKGVFKFAPDGHFLTRFGSEGEAPGQFRAPDAIAVDGLGRVFVSDLNDIEVFDSEGRYLDRIRLEQGVAFGMVFNADNELFAVTNAPRVLKFTIKKPE